MIKAKFSNEMIKHLEKLKNANFEKYIIDNETNGLSTYCKLGINTDSICLDILNEESSVNWFKTDCHIDKEDISIFSCKIRENNEIFKPYIEESEVISIVVNEKISNVKIVSDIINVNSGEYIIDYDMAIIIETEQHSYVFSRGWFFNEEIYVNVDKEIDDIYSIKEVKESWSNDGEFNVEVNRDINVI